MSKITVTGQLTLTGGQLTAKETPVPPLPGGKELWAFGKNTQGQLGLGDVIDRSSPVAVGALTNWSDIKVGQYQTLATKTDGTLWAWGEGDIGRLGLGNTTDYSSPVQVGALTNWASVGVTNGDQAFSSFGIKTNGELWAWGNGSSGVLGLGNITTYSSPVQVGGLTNWTDKISIGSLTTHAVKTDGTLWAWGPNTFGQLGLGDTSGTRSSPVQIGGLADWSKTGSASNVIVALKTDGTIWGWGRNNAGQSGHGDTVQRSSPVQIGSSTNWVDIIMGSSGNVHALNSIGELWAWGNNPSGSLGIGVSSADRSSPVQVGLLSDWSIISSGGDSHGHAIKTDGSLWSWGDGANGQLGDETIIDKSSPIQVGALVDWVNVESGSKHTFGLK